MFRTCVEKIYCRIHTNQNLTEAEMARCVQHYFEVQNYMVLVREEKYGALKLHADVFNNENVFKLNVIFTADCDKRILEGEYFHLPEMFFFLSLRC